MINTVFPKCIELNYWESVGASQSYVHVMNNEWVHCSVLDLAQYGSYCRFRIHCLLHWRTASHSSTLIVVNRNQGRRSRRICCSAKLFNMSDAEKTNALNIPQLTMHSHVDNNQSAVYCFVSVSFYHVWSWF